MSKSDEYKARADEALQQAANAPTDRERKAYRQMAEGWLRLAADAADLEARQSRRGGK